MGSFAFVSFQSFFSSLGLVGLMYFCKAFVILVFGVSGQIGIETMEMLVMPVEVKLSSGTFFVAVEEQRTGKLAAANPEVLEQCGLSASTKLSVELEAASGSAIGKFSCNVTLR